MMPRLYSSGAVAYATNRWFDCRMLPKIPDNPNKIGDSSITRVSSTRCSICPPENPGAMYGISCGVKTNVIPAATSMPIVPIVRTIEATRLASSVRLRASSPAKIGMNAAETAPKISTLNRKSGTRKAV